MKNKETRREFIVKATVMAMAVPCLGLLRGSVFAKEAPAVPLPSGQTAISESDAVASAIGFRHQVKDIDYVKYPMRKKKEAQQQFCKNCALYVPSNAGWGKCQMLTNGLVSAQGWCGSYSPKS